MIQNECFAYFLSCIFFRIASPIFGDSRRDVVRLVFLSLLHVLLESCFSRPR